MKLKRICSALLAATLLFSLLPTAVLAAPSGSVSVQIVGAAPKAEKNGSGAVTVTRETDLRDSQLLEAVVTGYTGEGPLYFKWINEVPKNSKIYAFNEYNMTVADAQEILYGHSSERLENYRYAAVSSEWAKDNDVDSDGKHQGTLKVEVYDGEGKIGEATYDKGFLNGSLQADLEAVPLGMFVGDTATALDLFGQMGVTHITCTNSSVTGMETVTGGQWEIGVISASQNNSVWYIKGEKVGEAQLKVTVSKGADCAFHRGQQNVEAIVGVHVFEKPDWESDYHSVTIKNLKDGYTYTIGNQSYTHDGAKTEHTFTGLNSNTTYQLRVQEYCSEKNAEVFAYLSVSTKSLHRVGVYVAKNNIPNRIDDGVDTLTLKKGTETHILTYSEGDHGYFGAAPAGDWDIMHGDDKLGTVSVSKDIANARYIIYYSVTTDVNGTRSEEWLLAGEHVDAPLAPTEDHLLGGKLFAGWTADTAGDNQSAGATYQPEDHYKLALDAPVTWTAVLVEPKSVAVKVTLDPESESSSGSSRDESENATLKGVTLNLWKVEGTGVNINFSEAGKYTITGSEDGFNAESYTHTFTGLLPGNYQVTTSPKENYDATVTADSDEEISVKLKYNPQDFMLNFDVKLDNSAEGYVQAVECRITFYDADADGKFSYIEQHQNGGVSATFTDDQKETTVNYPVWQKANGATDNSRYGVEVMAYRLADGTTVLASDTNLPFKVQFEYKEDNSAAAVTSTGTAFKPTDDKGLHWDNTANSQAGSLTVTVTAEPKTITFDTGAGGNMPSDVGSSKDYIIMPRLRAIEPEPNEGYVFLGWKTAEGSPAAPEAGAVLTQDLRLVAQWAAPRNIEGTITVNHNNALLIDQLQTASVVLERKIAGSQGSNDVYEVCDVATVDVTVGSPTPSYKFENVPSALSANQRYTYRVRAVAINYAATYSTDSGTTWLANNNTVPDSNEVDITLTMEPEVFTLSYEINAGAIGAGFRPASMQVYVGFSPDGGAPYTVVSQMPNGKEVIWKRDGKADDTLDVWKQHTSGKVTRYQIGVGTEEVNGAKQLRPLVDDSLNYKISRGDEVHYDPINARAATTGTLTLKLEPKSYVVLLDLNGGNYLGTPDGYKLYEEQGNQGNDVTLWTTQHTWSKPTTIATPTRAGYHLTGWKEVNVDGSSLGTPNRIEGSRLDASVARTIRLKAQWAPGDPPTGGSSGSDSGRKENDGGGKPVQPPEVFARLNTSERIAYIQGYEDGTVRPEAPITRGELAMMFYRLLTGDYRRSIFSTSNSYWDITAGIWYNTPVSSFSNAGILKGFSDGSFGGD